LRPGCDSPGPGEELGDEQAEDEPTARWRWRDFSDSPEKINLGTIRVI
jgi:hypothetical protein